ncbi:hypothetical protein LQZ18_00395 [Lachnospiraceae bacterium ZAX-1]
MDTAIQYYLNPNTMAYTTNRENTKLVDKENKGFLFAQMKPVEDLMTVLKTPIRLANRTVINREENSADIAAGMRVTVNAGYVLTVKPQGVEVSGGDPYNQAAWQEASNMAGALSTLLRNAGGTMNTISHSEEGYQKWTDYVTKFMSYLGIDTTKDFTVNGVKYAKNENGYFESERTTEANLAYERLKANNTTYQYADEDTKKRINHMSRYYMQDVPEGVLDAWDKALAKTGINPFPMGYANTLSQLAQEQDFATGGNDDIFGDSIESVTKAVENILERIEHPLGSVNTDRLAQEKKFYEAFLEHIQTIS